MLGPWILKNPRIQKVLLRIFFFTPILSKINTKYICCSKSARGRIWLFHTIWELSSTNTIWFSYKLLSSKNNKILKNQNPSSNKPVSPLTVVLLFKIWKSPQIIINSIVASNYVLMIIGQPRCDIIEVVCLLFKKIINFY